MLHGGLNIKENQGKVQEGRASEVEGAKALWKGPAWVFGCMCISRSIVPLFVAPWTVAHQAPPSMGFSRQEYWIGLPFPSPGDLPGSGIEPCS